MKALTKETSDITPELPQGAAQTGGTFPAGEFIHEEGTFARIYKDMQAKAEQNNLNPFGGSSPRRNLNTLQGKEPSFEDYEKKYPSMNNNDKSGGYRMNGRTDRTASLMRDLIERRGLRALEEGDVDKAASMAVTLAAFEESEKLGVELEDKVAALNKLLAEEENGTMQDVQAKLACSGNVCDVLDLLAYRDKVASAVPPAPVEEPPSRWRHPAMRYVYGGLGAAGLGVALGAGRGKLGAKLLTKHLSPYNVYRTKLLSRGLLAGGLGTAGAGAAGMRDWGDSLSGRFMNMVGRNPLTVGAAAGVGAAAVMRSGDLNALARYKEHSKKIADYKRQVAQLEPGTARSAAARDALNRKIATQTQSFYGSNPGVRARGLPMGYFTNPASGPLPGEDAIPAAAIGLGLGLLGKEYNRPRSWLRDYTGGTNVSIIPASAPGAESQRMGGRALNPWAMGAGAGAAGMAGHYLLSQGLGLDSPSIPTILGTGAAAALTGAGAANLYNYLGVQYPNVDRPRSKDFI